MGRLPECEQVVAHTVEDQRGESIEVQSGFHALGVRNEYLQPGIDPLLHPRFPFLRGDGGSQNVRMDALLVQKALELPL